MGTNDEKLSRNSSMKRTRSLSESIKGLFKPPNNGTNNSSSAITRNNTPSTPVIENPASTLKKNNSRLGKLATNKEAELSSSRGAPSTPVQTPVGQRQHHLGLGNLAKLSLAQGSPPSSSENDRISQESFLSEDDDSSRPRRHAAEQLPEEVDEVQEHPKSGRQRQRHQENKPFVPQGNPDEQDASQLIDAVLENDTDSNRNSSNPNHETQANNKRNRRNSTVRSRSLKRTDSTSSSSTSEGKIYPKGRSRADTFSASSLPRFSEIESKCILQVENFKVYENGVHEHNLKITSLVSDANDAHFGSDQIAKQKSGFSLSGIFKPHKEDNKQLENALSLIPAGRLSLSQRLDKARNQAIQSEESRRSTEGGINGYADEESEKRETEANDSRPTPKIVNPNAAVGTEELKLINALSEKIHRGLSGKLPKSENEDGKKDCPTKFYEQYGTPIGVIGHGAYGVVKICSRPKTSKDIPPLPTYSNGKRLFFAVKELRPKANDQMDKFSTRITSEFIIGHSLSRCHKKGDKVAPNILRVIDLMESPDAFVEVMEFCPSGDLYNLLTRKSKTGTALHPLEADCFMKQLLHGVQFMHRHGVAHCDLKPENILFHPDGLLKICDFGTSCVFQTAWEKQVHFQSGTMGSEPYVAPEEFIHSKEYDPRLTDCWSCGVVYCTMVLGHYLWKVALRGKDMLYDSFYDELAEHKEFYVFEEMRHVNNEIGRLRKIALYNIFQVDPEKRITVDELLQTAWMKRTRCCVFYKPSDRDR